MSSDNEGNVEEIMKKCEHPTMKGGGEINGEMNWKLPRNLIPI